MALQVGDSRAPRDGQLDPLDPSVRYISRELSELDFNGRLLDLAEDSKVPVLEKAKFLAICSERGDEFFQVRVAGLKDQVEAGLSSRSPEGRNPIERLQAIRRKMVGLVDRQSRVFAESLVPALAGVGVSICDWQELDPAARAHLGEVFESLIFPVLTPLAVDPGHPFPYISNLSLNLAVMVNDPETKEQRFARVKVPPLLPRFVMLPDEERFVALEQVIAAHLETLFPNMAIGAHYCFRVTRNADLTLEEGEADDLLAAVEMELRRRRFGRAVRLEIEPKTPDDVRELLMHELEIGPDDVYDIDSPLGLEGLWAVYGLAKPELHDEAWAPMTPPHLATAGDDPVDLFAVMKERDVLVHHPYDSFTTSVEAFIAQAADDPGVLAIKQTLYRTSGDSPIVASLIRAAEQGKQVAALVEVKARFDEQANIAWARALEEAGVHVVYGLVGLKTHVKTALVVRREDDGLLRRYCHVGTGNYNSKTARLYDDLGLLSADRELGADLSDMFNFLTGYSRRSIYHRLILAPGELRSRMIELIEEQALAGPEGRIIMKVNGLDDSPIIDALYAASAAGVPIDLVVRAICSLRPGVPGLSETIRVRSIVGRFLEHSRIFSFGAVGSAAKYLIGSADMRTRNLDRRIEAVISVDDPEAKARLREILEINLADDTNAWVLSPDGTWSRTTTVHGTNTHARMQELARERARRRRGPDSLSSRPHP